MMGGRLNSRDQFREWRLDVDNMTYEVRVLSPVKLSLISIKQ